MDIFHQPLRGQFFDSLIERMENWSAGVGNMGFFLLLPCSRRH
jgi:hypothetical protein